MERDKDMAGLRGMYEVSGTYKGMDMAKGKSTSATTAAIVNPDMGDVLEAAGMVLNSKTCTGDVGMVSVSRAAIDALELAVELATE